MSVESEILRIQRNIANAYAAVSGKGGEVPLQPTSASLAASVESIPQGLAYTPGDGIDITETEAGAEISVSLPTRTVTEAEYDALTAEEKQAEVLYAVTDDAGGSGGGASEVVYSTEEVRIGTWIDGKPLYRKVAENTVQNATSSWAEVTTIPNIDQLIFAYGSVLASDESGAFPVPNMLSAIKWERPDKIVYTTTKENLSNTTIHAIILYTKTTDEGGTA